ncbi:MAG: hypothetical protein KBT11_08230 [Treponema sp.]|nr:hypothetical protein [Candidatus Treponema equifaecale]
MKKYLGIFTCACTLLFLASCGSTPKAEPELDFDPTEKAEEVIEETKPEVVEEVADFSAANQLLLETAEKARQAAIDADAQKFYADKFNETDKLYTEIKNACAADSKKDASAEIKDITQKFESLAKASLAQSMKKRAEEMGFSGEDPDSYDKGSKALAEYDALENAASGADMLAKANEAFNAYSVLMVKGFSAFAAKERNAALEAKKNADSVKAGVAKKAEYAKASEAFKNADAAYVTKDIENAYRGYKSSKEIYSELFETVSKNRAAALAAIERAKQAVADAESYSTEADTIAPLESEVAGIEKEDAVLLEADNLANPEDAVINIEEGTTAQVAEKAAAAAIAVEEAAKSILSTSEAK